MAFRAVMFSQERVRATAIGFGLVCLVGVVGSCDGEGTVRASEGSLAIEDQLAALAKAGVVANPGVSAADLIGSGSRADLEGKPFAGLVEALGGERKGEHLTPLCDSLWMCDFKCIMGHGCYRKIVLRLERLSGQALKLTDVHDYVDLEGGTAWVQFVCGGQRLRWDFRVDEGWIDPMVLVEYDALLETAGCATRIYINDKDYGRAALLAAFRPEQKAAFAGLSSVELRRLDK